MAAALSMLAFVTPTAYADPQSDAVAAIDAAWDAAGGDNSSLGAREGDVYAAGTGFGQNFSGGAIFFTPDSGAHIMHGAILEKYRALGGPESSDLGFPVIDEGPGRIDGDSRNSIFSAPDQPVIFWTADTGAWVVRGAINAAWDALGGSSGTLGVPTADQTSDGNVLTQTFSGGKISFDTDTRTFTTEPADLAGQLGNVVIPETAAPAAPAPTATATPTEPTVAAPSPEPTATSAAPAPNGAKPHSVGWKNSWLWWIIPLALLLLGSLAALTAGRRRRAVAVEAEPDYRRLPEQPAYEPAPAEREHWQVPPARQTDYDGPLFNEPLVEDRVADTTRIEQPDVESERVEEVVPGTWGAHAAMDDADAIDTAPTRVQSADDALISTGRHAAIDVNAPYPPEPEYVADVMEPDIHHAEHVDVVEDDYFVEPDDSVPAEPEVIEAETVGYEPTGYETGEYDDPAGYDAPVVHETGPEAPALHLPLADPHLAPEGYPVKGRMSTGTYHTPDSPDYDAIVAEIWFADAAHAEGNGFVRA